MVPCPTRGIRSGLVFAGILLVAANLRASITVVGPLLHEVQLELAMTSTEAAALIALPVLFFALLSPIAPMLGRRLGVERSLGLALGVLSVAIVLRSLPWTTSLWIGTAGIGAAIAVMNVLLPPLVKRDFPTDVGRVTGAYSAVQSAVAALASAVAVPLAGAASGGWRLAFGVWAGLALVALGLFLPLLAGGANAQRAASVRSAHGIRESIPLNLRVPWRTALGWQIALFSGSQALLYYTVLAWWPTVERASGVSSVDAGLHQGLLQMVGIAASLAAGLLLHRLGSNVRLAVLVFAAPSMLALVGQMLWPEAALLWVLLLGLGIGGTFVVSMSLLSLRTAHPVQTAQLSALAQSVGYALAALGPLTAGGLAQTVGTWIPTLVVLLGLQLIQLGLGLASARQKLI